jgi:ATP-dependent RNA helicase DeaD
MLAALLAPVELDEEDRALGRQLLAERSAEEIAAALVRAHRAALPAPEELIEASSEAARTPRQEATRPGFEEAVWFRMDIGRRQNADPRWILPLLCRRGRITRSEVGAIRIAPDETWFQVPRGIASRFAAAVARSADQGGEEDGGVRIERAEGEPKSSPRAAPGGQRRPGPRTLRAAPRPEHKGSRTRQ